MQVVFSFNKHDNNSGTTLRFELRDDNTDPNVDPVPAAAMWNILLPILMDFEELLHSYTGKNRNVSKVQGHKTLDRSLKYLKKAHISFFCLKGISD